MTHKMTHEELAREEQKMDVIEDCANRYTVPWHVVIDFVREESLGDDVLASILCYCRMEGTA